MSSERDAMKRLCKFKRRLGDAILACGQDESLCRNVLMFAQASFECLQAREIRFTLGTSYAFGTYSGVHRNPAPHWADNESQGITNHEAQQNKHALHCIKQWEGEYGFCLERLNAALDASTSTRLTSRLMSTLTELTKKNRERLRWVRQQENEGQKKSTSRGQQEVFDYTDKHGRVDFVPTGGVAHMFSTADAATAFRRTTKEQVEGEESSDKYASPGFEAYAALMEEITRLSGTPACKDEFLRYLEYRRKNERPENATQEN